MNGVGRESPVNPGTIQYRSTIARHRAGHFESVTWEVLPAPVPDPTHVLVKTTDAALRGEVCNALQAVQEKFSRLEERVGVLFTTDTQRLGSLDDLYARVFAYGTRLDGHDARIAACEERLDRSERTAQGFNTSLTSATETLGAVEENTAIIVNTIASTPIQETMTAMMGRIEGFMRSVDSRFARLEARMDAIERGRSS